MIAKLFVYRSVKFDRKTKEPHIKDEPLLIIHGADDLGVEMFGSLEDLQKVYDALPEPICLARVYANGFISW